jgi:hypothetical protein
MNKPELIALVREAINRKNIAGFAMMGLVEDSMKRLQKAGITPNYDQEVRSLWVETGAVTHDLNGITFLLDAGQEQYWVVWSLKRHPKYPGMAKKDKCRGYIHMNDLK